MIRGFSIENAILELAKKKKPLVEEKLLLIDKIKALEISKQAAWKYRKGIIRKMPTDVDVDDDFELRKTYATRITTIEAELLKINNEYKELNRLYASDENNVLVNIFKEVFTTDQMREMRDEAKSRINGNPPTRVSFNVANTVKYKDERDKYKKLAKEQTEKMIEFRILLTKVIEDGCQKFDQGEFLKIISPLNRLIIPVNELNKIKIRHNL